MTTNKDSSDSSTTRPGGGDWYATVTFRRPDLPDPVTDEQWDALTRALPGYGVVVDDGVDRLRTDLQVSAPTARVACEAAIAAARAAYRAAFGGIGDITAVRVLTAADWEREQAHPGEVELVGNREAAALLGVQPQRVDQLARKHPDWPDPIARLAAGPVYTRASIAAFDKRWQRKSGRPRKSA